ncbi:MULTISPECIES: helix-turn-helix domain-containing protein [unclassified Curtobacterium]|uniref:helix-turn-helix domain-containing protein n=1 Tax=unclassified Curtobacterium TaxID=257496 RepID=UPI00226B2DD7|nr:MULTISPECIES: helix-turn-helix domain-containing protein [unclassified Curtobacterium]
MKRTSDAAYLTVGETARLLGVHPNTVRNWAAKGTLVSARLPGAKQHRFAREHVLEFAAHRGEAVSSIVPMVKPLGPDLVRAADLDAWAMSEDAKGAFPELMRRLLAASSHVVDLDIRSHEGVAAPGWDGSASSGGGPFLPRGDLRFEFGTEKDSKRKAQADYDKRVGFDASAKQHTFVYATPRNWAGGRAWADARSKDGVFAAVKAIDAHVLEGWLQSTPSVHYWLSERLGRHPRNARVITDWWLSFSGRSRLELPTAFFTAGRATEAEQLTQVIVDAASDAVITVRAPWVDDALAFVHAALHPAGDVIDRVLVVTDAAAWTSLSASSQPMVLIPYFDGRPDIKIATDAGHRVILVAGATETVRPGNGIDLPKIDRVEARQVLEESDVDFHTAEELVALGRRSMPALFRSIARDPRATVPPWAIDGAVAAILAPLILAGSWTSTPADSAVIECLTETSSRSVEQQLRTLAATAEAPFVHSGGLWRPVAPVEAALLLFPHLTDADLHRWRETVIHHLLAEDPLEALTPVERIAASVSDSESSISGTLRQHLADGVALAGATALDVSAAVDVNPYVRSIVRAVLQRANDDGSGGTWARIASVLPALAEAAPDEFLEAVELGAGGPDSILRTVFRDGSAAGDPFAPSSPHTSLLWALESLSWSPSYFGHVGRLLAKLSMLDPGGRLSNRPSASLQNLTRAIFPYGGGGVDDKIGIISRVIDFAPEIGWSLVLSGLPSMRAVGLVPHRPSYRDWGPKRNSVTYEEVHRYSQALVKIAVSAAGDTPERWTQLVSKVDRLPQGGREIVLRTLQGVIESSGWSSENRYAVWEALTKEISRHEDYADADWALDADGLGLLKSVADRLASPEDPRRLARIFDWRPSVPGRRLGREGYRERLADMQREAVEELIAFSPVELEAFMSSVPVPRLVGQAMADFGDLPATRVLDWLSREEVHLVEAASSFARSRMLTNGESWLGGVFRDIPRVPLSLMNAVPFERRFWQVVDELDQDYQVEYWSHVSHYEVPLGERDEAVQLLLEHKRPWAAVHLVAALLEEHSTFDNSITLSVLEALLHFPGPPEDAQMTGYSVATILNHLEAVLPEEPSLPSLEFALFNLLPDHRPSSALYRRLNSDPDEFVALMKGVFRGDGEQKRDRTAKESAFGTLAFSILHEWRGLPGSKRDGSIDAEHLTAWVQAARSALSDAGRAAIGDEQIGQILSVSPVGEDGIWPAEPVRDLIESLVSIRIETGLHVGRTNQRGFTSRAVYDGGDQERELERNYRDSAAALAVRWPRTASVLRGIAEGYLREAKMHDLEAERLGDE